MRNPAYLFPLIATLAAVGCSDHATVEPIPQQTDASPSNRGARQVVVMSRNMYIGADVDQVVRALATNGDVTAALQSALTQLQRTDFPTRMQGIADEIALNRPGVLGLQEAYVLDVDLASLGMGEGTIHLDFLGALRAALAARGLNYVVAGVSNLTDANLAGGAIHLVDHDALLIDPAHVTLTGSVTTSTFTYNLPALASLSLLRGYIAQPAIVEGVPALIVNSHTESGWDEGLRELRAAQAMELAAVTEGVPNVILMGDLNDIPGSLLHAVLAGAGLTDVWAAMRPDVPGYSCCQSADLSNRLPALDQRIDYVWTRGFTGPSGALQGHVTLTSDTPSGLLNGAFGMVWPSDHAGLVATLLLPPAAAR